MRPSTDVARMLQHEARALLTRLARVRPFALHETMVPAAAPSREALAGIEGYLRRGRQELRRRVKGFLAWLDGPGRFAPPPVAQRRFVYVRLRFNVVLTHFDTFGDVITQRSQHETGVWLSGLDAVAADALRLRKRYFDSPPVVCYLGRGLGAAIRRVSTRLPGGGASPVALIRVPRERMVGTGIASSLVHEVGHQGIALLDLVPTLRAALERRGSTTPDGGVWSVWGRWISEILADLWSVARVGVASTTGLMSVVSLPRVFVFRVNLNDPHPTPWLRLRISCALGDALYPDPQWGRLSELWGSLYPLADDVTTEQRSRIRALERGIPDLVRVVLGHRPRSLQGDSVGDALRDPARTPARLRAAMQGGRPALRALRKAPPSFAFAALGQARADRALSPEQESRVLGELLTYWALQRSIGDGSACGTEPLGRRPALKIA